MSGYENFNFPAFDEAVAVLRSQGRVVGSPHEVPHPGLPGSMPWTDYLRGDLKLLLDCTSIVMLQGWPQSRGAKLELITALSLDMPVYFYENGRLVNMNGLAIGLP